MLASSRALLLLTPCVVFPQETFALFVTSATTTTTLTARWWSVDAVTTGFTQSVKTWPVSWRLKNEPNQKLPSQEDVSSVEYQSALEKRSMLSQPDNSGKKEVYCHEIFAKMVLCLKRCCCISSTQIMEVRCTLLVSVANWNVMNWFKTLVSVIQHYFL